MQTSPILTKIIIGIIVLLIVIGLAVYLPKNDPEALTEVGQPAPDFETTMLDGDKIRLSGLRGKAVLVVFFATWCPPCNRELPVLEKELWAEFRSDKFQILAIAREQSEADVRPFKAEKKLTFTFATDPKRIAFAKYATEGIPRTYLIAPDGKIAYQAAGYNKEDILKLRKIIADLLKSA